MKAKSMKGITWGISLLLVIFLAACGSDEGANGSNGNDGLDNTPSVSEEVEVYPENGLPVNEKVTLKMGFFESGMGREYIDYAIETFTEKFPNVTFDVTYSPTVQEIVSAKIAAGDDEDMFDMFNSGLPGGGATIAAYVEEGLFEDQEDLWDRKLYDADGTVREMTADGTYETFARVLGTTPNLPNAGTSAGLFFDKNLFEEKGWDMEPQTWTEFLDLLETIKQDGMIPVTYTGVHATYIQNAFGFWKQFEIADANGNLEQFTENFRNWTPPYYSSPEHLELWNKLYEMGQKGYFPQGVAALDHTQSQMQVLQGQAALVSSGSWVENEMIDATPDGFEWGYMVVPMTDNPNANKWTRLTTSNGFYIWSGKPELNKQWAKEFNLWMLNLDVQTVIGETAGSLPLRRDFTENPELFDRLQPLLKNIVAYNENNEVRVESGYRDVTLTDPAFAQASKVYNEAITLMTEGKQEPLPIMEEADKLLEQAYEAYLKEKK